MDPVYPDPAYPPRPPRRAPDPVAVVLGNATLLGFGYLFLRRWRLALLALAGTTALLVALAATTGSGQVLAGLAVWWVAGTGHGWWLVRGVRPTGTRWGQRAVAAGVVVALVGVVVVQHGATERTVADAAAAHATGDCERTSELVRGLDAADRAVNGPAVRGAAADLEACELLLEARGLVQPGVPDRTDAAEVAAAYLRHPGARWSGAGPWRADLLLRSAYSDSHGPDQGALEAGFDQLEASLAETPDEAGEVRAVVEAFLTRLAEVEDHCAVRDVVEWVDAGDWAGPEVAEPVAAAADEVPRRVLGCARDLADADEITASRRTYEAFLRDHRDDRRAGVASDELDDVVTAIQRKKVARLLDTGRYCAHPEPYRGATGYRRKGGNPMQVFGIKPAAHDFPRPWLAGDVDDTVLVACVDGPKRGSYQETCAYESDLFPYWSDVRFYASRFDVRLYEVRTGKQVEAFSDEFGDPCPPSILVTTFGSFATPPETKRSAFDSADLRGMFEVYQS